MLQVAYITECTGTVQLTLAQKRALAGLLPHYSSELAIRGGVLRGHPLQHFNSTPLTTPSRRLKRLWYHGCRKHPSPDAQLVALQISSSAAPFQVAQNANTPVVECALSLQGCATPAALYAASIASTSQWASLCLEKGFLSECEANKLLYSVLQSGLISASRL